MRKEFFEYHSYRSLIKIILNFKGSQKNIRMITKTVNLRKL